MVVAVEPGLERQLRRNVAGEVMFDPFSRGRYATDASHYQIMPAGVVVPKSRQDIEAVISIARDTGVPVTARGGGTSQCGQTINSGLIVDTSKHLNKIIELDVEARRCVVEPGIVLDDLNRQLKQHGLWFPVDVSTASRATIGGMVGNNSCGGRSIRYGTTRSNVLSIEAILADGTLRQFDPVGDAPTALDKQLLTIGEREAGEVAKRFPKVQRRVGGYNIDALVPGDDPNNMAHILVGSEGTLGFSTAIELKLWPVMGHRVMGVCHFPTFYSAMDAAQHLVTLGPLAVELVDATMVGLARDIEMFQPVVREVVRGEPAALLVVEFMEDSDEANLHKLVELEEMMGALGFSWSGQGEACGRCRPG